MAGGVCVRYAGGGMSASGRSARRHPSRHPGGLPGEPRGAASGLLGQDGGQPAGSALAKAAGIVKDDHAAGVQQ